MSLRFQLSRGLAPGRPQLFESCLFRASFGNPTWMLHQLRNGRCCFFFNPSARSFNFKNFLNNFNAIGFLCDNGFVFAAPVWSLKRLVSHSRSKLELNTVLKRASMLSAYTFISVWFKYPELTVFPSKSFFFLILNDRSVTLGGIYSTNWGNYQDICEPMYERAVKSGGEKKKSIQRWRTTDFKLPLVKMFVHAKMISKSAICFGFS